MTRVAAVSVLFGVAAFAACIAAPLAPFAEAQRPAYPIAREILVKQNCAILLAPAKPTPSPEKAKFERDATICHLEGIHTSEHMEEAIKGAQLMRNRVRVQEQEFVLQNISGDPVVFVVERNVPKGWRIDSDPQPVELIPEAGTRSSSNAKVAVFRVNAAPGEIVHLHVGERLTTPLKTKVLKSPSGAGSL